jgi:salicylate 5-hydroxylase large subunit
MTRRPDKTPGLVWPEEGLTRIPYTVYEDPDLYRQEQERIFQGPTWNFVGLAAEIPGPGDFIRHYVGETPVIVVRDGDGKINVHINRCAHRGVQFCWEPCGNTRVFTCPYHQWSYGLKGDLRGVPLRKGARGLGGMPDDFDPREHGLQSLRVTVHNGAIFATFSQETPAFEDYLEPINLKYFNRLFDGRPLKVLGKQRQRISCNWKHIVENIRDPYHATLLHAFFVRFKLWRADQDYAMRLNEDGGCIIEFIQKAEEAPEVVTRETTSFHAEINLADPSIVSALPDYAEGGNTMQSIWPNLIVQQTLNSLATRHAVPHGPSEFELHWTFFGYENDTPEKTMCRLRNASLFGPAGLVSADDSEVMVAIQNGAETPPTTASFVKMGGSGTIDVDGMADETLVRAFYKCWRKFMSV